MASKGRKLSNLAGKKMSLLFQDVINQEFSPKFEGQLLISPIFSSSKAKTGKTPKALAFSMFGNTDLFVDELKTSDSNLFRTSPTTAADQTGTSAAELIAGPSSKAGGILVSRKRLRGERDELEYDESANLVSKQRLLMDDDCVREDDDFASAERVLAILEVDADGSSAGNSGDELEHSHSAFSGQQSSASSAGASPSAEICPYFLKGGCRFRKNCRLSHSIGANCPYCAQPLPTTWTQQSKHLKKCWEAQVEDEELVNSVDISCQRCGMDVVAQQQMFGLLNACIHAYCLGCVEQMWDMRRKAVECPICKKLSNCVIARDRMYFDEERKAKMFGIYMKKLEVKRQQQLLHQQQYHNHHSGNSSRHQQQQHHSSGSASGHHKRPAKTVRA